LENQHISGWYWIAITDAEVEGVFLSLSRHEPAYEGKCGDVCCVRE